MSGLLIRNFAPPDAPACTRVFARAWAVGHPYAPRRIDAAIFADETLGERVVVAVETQAVVGFVALFAPKGFVHHLYVDPDRHGNGIGRALLGRAVQIAGGAASLKCQLRNAGALRFYRRCGWRDAETGTSDAGPWIRMLSP